MKVNIVKFFECNWTCKCGNVLAEDRNFCVQCDRERPLGN